MGLDVVDQRCHRYEPGSTKSALLLQREAAYRRLVAVLLGGVDHFQHTAAGQPRDGATSTNSGDTGIFRQSREIAGRGGAQGASFGVVCGVHTPVNVTPTRPDEVGVLVREYADLSPGGERRN